MRCPLLFFIARRARENQFDDPNLEVVIREVIDKPEGPITKSDLQRITEFEAPDSNIRDITGIEKCVNLESLLLGGTKETNWINSNEIKDISPLEGLMNLTELNLDDNKISDITPLSNLTNLSKLFLHYNKISNITSLLNLTKLTDLWLHFNKISDLTILSSLTKLADLSLAENKIRDIRPLVDNKYIGKGSRVDLRGNPLNYEAYDLHISALQERGVKLLFNPKMTISKITILGH